MAGAFQTIVETVKDPACGGAADFNFHLSIVEAAHSPTLLSVYVAIGKLLEQSHIERRRKIENIPGINRYLIDHHGAILAAIQERDANRAEKLLIEHFEIGASLRNGASIALLRPPSSPLHGEATPVVGPQVDEWICWIMAIAGGHVPVRR